VGKPLQADEVILRTITDFSDFPTKQELTLVKIPADDAHVEPPPNSLLP
jgi:hypothetical protein